MDKGGPVSWTPLRGGRRDGRDEKRRQCSNERSRIGIVKRLLALLLGGLGLRALFRSRPAPVSGPDPADELRAKLAEKREPEPEVAPEPEPAPEGVDARRADVHARARQALDDLKQ
jgi:hypothetical protein